MSDCCSNHQKDNKVKNKEDEVEEKPKSFIGRYLYKLGKEETKRVKGKDCC